MGAIGGLLGVNGGASGTGFAGPEQAKDQTGMVNLQDSYQRLQQVASGQGPNPAQMQYNQNVQDLAKQQSGAISSIQGISPALSARMASQQGSAALQNAAAQGVTAQSQQQLGALGQMGNVAGSQANAANQMQGNINNANMGLAQTTMQGQQGFIGGLMNYAGNAMTMGGGGGGGGARGGVVGKDFAVQNYADGGETNGPQSQFTNFLNSQVSQPQQQQIATPVYQPAVSGIGQGLGGAGGMNSMGKKPSMPGGGGGMGDMAGGAGDSGGASGMGSMAILAAARGGGVSKKVQAMLSPGETYIPPGKIDQAIRGNPLKAGTRIPGKPKVPGNSYANDTVPKTLEAGGIVIPNSIMQSKNPADGARDMVAAIIAKRGKK